MSGDLRLLPPFELLPMLADLGKSGLLLLRRVDGLVARCGVVPGGITTAEAGHLTGREAVLTFLWWNDGKFEFEAGPAPPGEVERIRVPELLMDAVRLADETERHQNAIPPKVRPLELVPDVEAGPDEFDCGIAVVFDYLRDHPGTTYVELEERLPLAPTKIRLSVALLGLSGKLRDFRLRMHSGVFGRIAVTWWQSLLRRFPGGIRILVASCRAGTSEQIGLAVRSLEESLQAPDPSMTFAADGPTFVRMRPRQGGLLSLTFLPPGKKHRIIFETFVGSTDAVILCSAPCSCGEQGDLAWAVPLTVRKVFLQEGATLERGLARALMSLGEAEEGPA